jgi:hypothetical protein
LAPGLLVKQHLADRHLAVTVFWLKLSNCDIGNLQIQI